MANFILFIGGLRRTDKLIFTHLSYFHLTHPTEIKVNLYYLMGNFISFIGGLRRTDKLIFTHLNYFRLTHPTETSHF